MLRLWLALLVGALLVIGSGVVATMARAQSGPDPGAIIAGYESARGRRDVDGALAFFADDATITQRNATYAGKDEIRKFLETSMARSRIDMSDRHASGNRVMWTERAAPQTTEQPRGAQATRPSPTGPGGPGAPGGGVIAPSGAAPNLSFSVTVEAVVQDGKIHSLAYLTGNQPQRIDPSLEGRAQLPASAGLAAVVLVMLGVLGVASLSFRRRLTAPSSLQGRMLEDLQGWSAARQ